MDWKYEDNMMLLCLIVTLEIRIITQGGAVE